MTIFESFDNCWQLLTIFVNLIFLTFLTIFNNVDNFWQFWTILTISDNFWQFLTILTIYVNLNNFWQFLTILNIFKIFTILICLQFLQFLTIDDNFHNSDDCFCHFDNWKDNPGDIPDICHFFTLTHFEAWKFLHSSA